MAQDIASFGERLRDLRKQADKTQEGLARAANVSTSSVSKLEAGTVEPSWAMVQALAKALGVGVEAFAEGSAKKKRGKR